MTTTKPADELYTKTTEIRNHFDGSLKSSNTNYKWSLLKDYSAKYLESDKISLDLLTSYNCIALALLDSLKPTLFIEEWQEDVFDNIFIHGIHHEAFILLVRKLGESCESYKQQKILNLLKKFLHEKCLTPLILQQCQRSGVWDPEHEMLSKTWKDLLMFLASLPDRIANKTKGKMHKIFCADIYVPLLISSIIKVLTSLHLQITQSQNCTLEFVGKLIGKLCVLGHSELVAKRLTVELVNRCEKDFVWRRLAQNVIVKIPLCSLEPFITQLLLVVPWYGYLEWILGDEGMKNEKLKCIMSTKLLFFHYFKKEIILQNIIAYFASLPSRQSIFWEIFRSLITYWADERVFKHQSFEQQKYIASALIICSGWLKEIKDVSNARAYLDKVLHGTMIRIGNSEQDVRNLGMVVGKLVVSSIDLNGPRLSFKDVIDKDTLRNYKKLLITPSKPEEDSMFTEEMNFFKAIEFRLGIKKDHVIEKNATESSNATLEIDSEDDMEPYDTSNDIPRVKRPYYLNDCLLGLIEQDNLEWFEQCLKHAENLIESNADKVHEVAVEMAKVMLHLENKYAIEDFETIRHRILVSLTIHCPVLVADFFTSHFYMDEFSIRQRLDILQVIADSCLQLSQPKSAVKKPEPQNLHSAKKALASAEMIWKTIIDQRVAAKTRHITKLKSAPPKAVENRFAHVAGYFFFPLMEKYDRINVKFKLFEDDSYVLGQLVYTLGAVMHAAANILMCEDMGYSLLQFLAEVRNHHDVFVREASIFAMAAVYMSVPGYLLFSDKMTILVFESKEWLQSVVENDSEIKTIMKASYALSVILNIIENEMPLVCDLLLTAKNA
ncbi:telomere length regulation protein TEL2 homolog [Trichonephila inaurata madagascariensis]|uniref:Telomere length regulation protein TEL2 homolog n=1 Tax=Trichonephila inaurata madagascariensis TaxID=2747483 RepID=A0A8X6MIW3_9ARAC|nr:telomere length regulation protein TEL2 homolog [Trichonephila inaurata madagascariensis]